MSKTIKRTLLLALCLAAIWILAPPSSFADDWDKATKLTVNQPFEIPGMILPAGTYVVKIVDLLTDRHVVRFSNEDQTTVYATILAIPDYRMEATDDSVFSFSEPEVGRVPSLRRWFYPGHLGGVEFAYPERGSAGIAAVNEELLASVKEPEATTVFREKPSPSPPVNEFVEEPTAEVQPAGEEFEVPAVEPAPEPAVEPEPEPLPKTATPFPLVALVGLLAAGAASGLGLVRKVM